MLRNDNVMYGHHGTLWFSDEEVVVHSPDRPIHGIDKTNWRGFPYCYQTSFTPLLDVSQESLIDHFDDCIKGVRAPTCGAQQQLHAHEILFKGTDAVHAGGVRELETTFTPWQDIDRGCCTVRSRFESHVMGRVTGYVAVKLVVNGAAGQRQWFHTDCGHLVSIEGWRSFVMKV